MNWKDLIRSKTFWAAMAAIVGALGAFLVGEASLATTVILIVQALLAIFVRDGIAGLKNGK
jgi:hypothetical protein